jgi:UDP-glucose 4-epimerase
MRVAVTGANGFVGRAVVTTLLAHGHQVRALTRSPDTSLIIPGVEGIATGDIGAIEDWRPFLTGTEVVIHLAARAHVPDGRFADAGVIRAMNTTAALRLAEAAAKRGARRFVYLSSVKVIGESTPRDSPPLTSAAPLAPADLYARSKAEAEAGLAEIGARTGLSLTILRPPLVYGPGVRANFRALVKLVARAPALPFGAIRNRRSLVSVDNLASAIQASIGHPAAAGRTFFVTDGEDPSTGELVQAIAAGLDRRVALLPVPPALMTAAAGLFGKGEAMRRLTESLRVDGTEIRVALGWRPLETLREGVARAARAIVAAR